MIAIYGELMENITGQRRSDIVYRFDEALS